MEKNLYAVYCFDLNLTTETWIPDNRISFVALRNQIAFYFIVTTEPNLPYDIHYKKDTVILKMDLYLTGTMNEHDIIHTTITLPYTIILLSIWWITYNTKAYQL